MCIRDRFKAGDLAKAEQMFNKSNSVKNNASANMNLGLIALTKGDQAKAQQLFGNAAGVNELSEALGVLYLEQGEYAKAVNSFGSVKTNNAALAQILVKDYSKASQTLNGVATVSYTHLDVYKRQLILHAFRSLDIDLGRQVTFRIYLIVHIQRSVLGVTKVLFRVGLVNT